MRAIKEFLANRKFLKYSMFIVFNAALLYILYFLIKNMDRIALGLLQGIGSIISAFWPLFIGLILAYLINPLVEAIDKKLLQRFMVKEKNDPIKNEKQKKRSRLVSILITFIIIIAIIVLLIYGFSALIMGKVVFSGFSDMVTAITNNLDQYQQGLKKWAASNLPEGLLAEKLQAVSNGIMDWLSQHINTSSIINFFTTISGKILNIFIGTIVSIYLMKDKDYFIRLWRKFLHLVFPQKANAIITETLSEVNNVLSQFIRGALLDALIVAVLSSVALTIVGLDFAVFIGIFAGICNVIPYFGPLLGMIPAFLVGAFTGGFWDGAIAVIALIIVQQIDSNLIYPKVVGSSTGLHPLVVLLAVSVGGYYGAIIGMVIAVPIAGVIQAFVKKWALSREGKTKLQKE